MQLMENFSVTQSLTNLQITGDTSYKNICQKFHSGEFIARLLEYNEIFEDEKTSNLSSSHIMCSSINQKQDFFSSKRTNDVLS